MRSTLALSLTALALLAATTACGGGGGGEALPPEPAAESEAPLEPEEQPPAAAGNETQVEEAEATGPAAADSGAPLSCELTVVPSQVPLADGSIHVESLPDGFAYNSVPASQGPHHPEWLRWGVYDEPVPELNVVHNLEHGGITVQYGLDVSAETVSEILAWYEQDSNAIIVAPHEALASDIALAAWTVDDIDQSADEVYRSSEGKVLRCSGFDETAFTDFREAYRGQAPERIPIEMMPAGS